MLPVESVWRNTNVKEPGIVGVPLILPVEALRLSPGGTVPPPTEKLSGGVFGVNGVVSTMYGTPTVRDLSVKLSIPPTMMFAPTLSVKGPWQVQMKAYVPVAVGTPEYTLLEALKETPGGKLPPLE